ncbi:hypothetical protein K439DRAFT_1638653, partial [Ramaria rubella]
MTFIPSASSILSGNLFSLFVSAHVAWPLHMISFSQVRTLLNNVCYRKKREWQVIRTQRICLQRNLIPC